MLPIIIISFFVSIIQLLFYFSLFRMNTNVLNVLIVLVTLIPPFVGPGLMLVWFFCNTCTVCMKQTWEIEKDIKDNNPAIFAQNNRIARWLFNTSSPLIFWNTNASEMINENGK